METSLYFPPKAKAVPRPKSTPDPYKVDTACSASGDSLSFEAWMQRCGSRKSSSKPRDRRKLHQMAEDVPPLSEPEASGPLTSTTEAATSEMMQAAAAAADPRVAGGWC